MTRDLHFERERTAEAASALTAVRPDRLIEFAELRAGHGPVRDIETRDFGRELLEELADARNYATWWARQLALWPPEDADLHIALATSISWSLAHTAVAFQHATQARELSVDIRNAA